MPSSCAFALRVEAVIALQPLERVGDVGRQRGEDRADGVAAALVVLRAAR